jgi:thioredoxin
MKLLVTCCSLLLFGRASSYVALPGVMRAPRRATGLLAECMADAAPEEFASMKVKELKAELDRRNVVWRGIAFEKAELVRLCLLSADGDIAQEQDSVSPSSPLEEPAAAAASTEPPLTTTSDDDADAAEIYEAARAAAFDEAMGMKVKELRAALAERSVGWADCVEKSELAARLAGLMATASLFSRSGKLSPGTVGQLTGDELRLELADERTPLIIDVFATWCGPCKLLAPQLAQLAQTFGSSVRVAKLDSDLEPAISTELSVQGLPTLILYQQGKEVHRLEGVPGNANALEAIARQYLQL